MKDWKVYANCCRRPVGQRIVETLSPHECVEDCVNQLANTYDWDSVEDSDDAIDEVYEMFWDEMFRRYEENGVLYCGDYMLVRSAEKPDYIPDIVGYETLD